MIQALLAVIRVHKADAKVAENAAGALRAICDDGMYYEWSSN